MLYLLRQAQSCGFFRQLKINTTKERGVIRKMDGKSGRQHPTYTAMVLEAMKRLEETGGVSRQKITKFIRAQYPVASDHQIVNHHVSKAIRKGLEDGIVVQTKGKGASGSYKLKKQVSSDKPTDKKPRKINEKVAKTSSKRKSVSIMPAMKRRRHRLSAITKATVKKRLPKKEGKREGNSSTIKKSKPKKLLPIANPSTFSLSEETGNSSYGSEIECGGLKEKVNKMDLPREGHSRLMNRTVTMECVNAVSTHSDSSSAEEEEEEKGTKLSMGVKAKVAVTRKTATKKVAAEKPKPKPKTKQTKK